MGERGRATSHGRLSTAPTLEARGGGNAGRSGPEHRGARSLSLHGFVRAAELGGRQCGAETASRKGSSSTPGGGRGAAQNQGQWNSKAWEILRRRTEVSTSIFVFPPTARRHSPEAELGTGVGQKWCQVLALPFAGPEYLGRFSRVPENGKQHSFQDQASPPPDKDTASLPLDLI